MEWSPLVPALLVSNVHTSRTFYVEHAGFVVRFERQHPACAYLTRGGKVRFTIYMRTSTRSLANLPSVARPFPSHMTSRLATLRSFVPVLTQSSR